MNYEKNQAYVLVAALVIILALMGFQLISGFLSSSSGSDFVIIYTDCLEGNVDGDNGSLSFPPYISMLNSIRNSAKNNVLLLDSGDALYGYFLTTSSNGELIIDLMNIAGYDAIAIGDMDLNYDLSQLGQLKNRANFPFLCANLYDNNDELLFTPYTIKEVHGVRVGIFSVMSDNALSVMHPKIIDRVKIKDTVSTSREIVKQLESENVDVIVCLAHFCLNEGIDTPYTTEAFARDVRGIDLIIDDNTNSNDSSGNWVGDTLIVQSKRRGSSVGLVDVVYSKGGSITMYSQAQSASSIINSNFNNTAAEDRINSERDRYNSLKNEVIGSTDTVLIGDSFNTRLGLTNLGCLVADSLMWQSNANVAVINSASIRDSIPVGSITRAQVDSVLPLKDDIVVKNITGVDLISLMEKSLENYPNSSNNFLQFAGMTILIDPSNPPGKKIVAISVGGEPVAAAKIYKVATTEYLTAGGRFSEISNSKTDGFHGSSQDALSSYIQHNGAAVSDCDARLIVQP